MKLRLAQLLALYTSAAISLTATFLVGYFTYQDYRALHRQIVERSRELATGLAQAVEFPLFTGDTTLLRQQVQRAADHPLITGIEILDTDGNYLLRIGDPQPLNGLHLERLVTAQLLDAGEETLGLGAGGPPLELGRVRLGISLQETQRRQWALLAQGGLILLLCVGLGGAFSWWLGRRLARPIQALTEAADALAKGDLERRVALEGPAEVEALARHFNAMGEALQRAHENMAREVERATAALQRSLKRLEERNRELDEARRAAQAASDAKSRFLANMSHEIRTPMNAIVGFTRLLYKASPDPGQRHHLLTIQHSAESLLTLIDDILELAQMEEGNVHLRAVDFDLRVVLDDVCALLAPLAHEKRLELAVLVHEDVPTDLNGDPCRLKQILNNLIGNAIKYTPAGEVVVRVQCERTRDDGHGVMLRFSVSDTGIGIDAEQRQRIFQAFSQGDESITRSYEGSGLGLAIARSLVKRMGGDIDFESTPGMGTTFWFTIWVATQPPRPALPPPLAGRRVLLVEGHETARLALLLDLHRLGLEVHVYERLDEAEASDHWQRVPLRLVGVGCPRRLTRDELRRLAALANAEGPPVTLILANSASLADYQVLAQAGITSPLSKPVPRDLLTERLRQVFEGEDAATGTTGARPPIRAGRVLICEDNAVNRALYLALFQEMGVQPELVDSAEAALERLRQEPVDLVIMDVHMPGMSGVEAIHRIRELPPPANRVPIVCVSADVYSQRQCQEAGADAFLRKPIDEAALEAIVRRHLNGVAPTRGGSIQERLRERLLPLFKQSLPDHLTHLRAAWEARDIPRLRAELHKLNGACAYCHVPEICEAVKTLEAAIKEGKGDPDRALAELERAAQRLLADGETA